MAVWHLKKIKNADQENNKNQDCWFFFPTLTRLIIAITFIAYVPEKYLSARLDFTM
jgi:hypothetical protein